ncbi:lysophosphatidic acid receptor 6-like [Heptranchias perlo]|uniref:lysophosphatidic acid receptor 6-like n=1 Tax=Heptranchias perlo TaxID=212740 RepID=UPI00355A9494
MENDSDVSNDTIHFHYPLFTSVYGLTLAIGLPLNSISLWVFFTKLELRTAPVIYMTNLAISDLLFVLSLPFRIYYFATARWIFGNLVCIVSGTIFSVNFYTRSLLVTLISLDRYLAIVHPLNSRSLRSPKAAKVACAIVWLIVMLWSIPIGLYHQTITGQLNVTRCYEGFSFGTWQSAFVLISLVITMGFLVPFIIITICFFAVVRVMIRISKESQDFKKYKIIRLFLINVGVYVVCFVPFNFVLILYGMHQARYFSVRKIVQLFVAHAITVCLASISSCLDPIIYYFTTDAFRAFSMKSEKDTHNTIQLTKRKHQTTMDGTSPIT